MECKHCPTFILDLDNFPCYKKMIPCGNYWRSHKLLSESDWWSLLLSVYLLLLFHSRNFHLFKHKTFFTNNWTVLSRGNFHNKTIFYFSSSCFSCFSLLSLHLLFFCILRNNKLVLWVLVFFFWMVGKVF